MVAAPTALVRAGWRGAARRLAHVGEGGGFGSCAAVACAVAWAAACGVGRFSEGGVAHAGTRPRFLSRALPQPRERASQGVSMGGGGLYL